MRVLGVRVLGVCVCVCVCVYVCVHGHVCVCVFEKLGQIFYLNY